MDKSKMATPGTKINYDDRKERWDQDGMSRTVKQASISDYGCDCGCETGNKVKCITVKPGGQLSLQKHHHR